MFGLHKKRIYLDNASGTACSEVVYRSMLPYFKDLAFNPGGIYKESVEVKNIISQSREQVAKFLKSQPSEIYFTDGATEANNIAIIGTVKSWKKKNPKKRGHIITTVIEHAAVIEVCKFLETQDIDISYLEVNEKGLISLKDLKKSIRENTIIVSVAYVNGEIGTIQDMKGIVKTIRHYRKKESSVYPYLHTDAVQAVNYVDEIGVPQLGIDLMTINASKIYGPKKIAALFIKNSVLIDPIIYGGNQEKNIRSGTENVPYIVGFTEALIETRSLRESEVQRLSGLQSLLEKEILQYDPHIIINSTSQSKIPNIVNITVKDISHEELVIRLDAAGFMVSTKSACKTGEEGDSHVIKAISRGNRLNRATGSLRISLGREITKADLEKFMKSFTKIVDGMKDTHKKYAQ